MIVSDQQIMQASFFSFTYRAMSSSNSLVHLLEALQNEEYANVTDDFIRLCDNEYLACRKGVPVNQKNEFGNIERCIENCKKRKWQDARKCVEKAQTEISILQPCQQPKVCYLTERFLNC